MDGIYTMASPSSSSLYGNVGCAIRQLILSKFPYNYFQYMNVSTEIAFHNLRRQFGTNTNTEISKRQYPQLIVQPSYQVPDADGFLQNVPLTKNDMDIQSNIDRRYLFEIIKDSEHEWALKFKMNRDRIEYEVSVVTRTLHQQLDIYKAMMNQMTWDRSFYYPAALEAVIPKTMIQYISRLCNIDIYQYPELIPVFLRHINSISGYPITYKVRNASASDEFFMYYHHNLVVTYTDLQIDSGNKKGMLDESYTITFRVTVDFNLPGLFILDGADKNLQMLKSSAVVNDKIQSDNEFIPLFSLSDFYNRFPQRRDGLTLYGSFLFTSDETEKTDTADIGLLIEPEHQKAIRFHTRYGMLDKTICTIYIMKDSEELSKDEYRVNWDTMKIEYQNPDPNATYRVAIYMNMEVINADLANPRIHGPYDQHALTENTIDYSKIKNMTNFNLDNPKSTDTDFNGRNDNLNFDKPIPGIFRGKDLDPDRIDSMQDTLIAMPTSRDHENAWHLMSQENTDTSSYNDIDPVHESEIHSDNIQYTQNPNGTTSIVGDINLTDLEQCTLQDSTNEMQTNEETEVIMKYYSSIFDESSTLKVNKSESTPKKYKWSSSIENQEVEEKIHFTDSIEPSRYDAIDTWSKIIGTAMLYNYATKIAVENSNNYNMDVDGNIINPDVPSTKHQCSCGCEDETTCTCGWKDKLSTDTNE